MKHRVIPTLLLLVAFAAVNASSQAEISDSKRKLLNELVAMEYDRIDFENEFKQSFDDQQEMLAMFRSHEKLRDLSLSEEVQKELDEKISAATDRALNQLKERVSKELDLKGVLSRALFDSYNKRFSESEIADLIAFYKTSTGKKFMESSREMDRDLLKAVQTDLLPKLVVITNEIMDKEFKQLTDRILADPDLVPPVSGEKPRR